LQNEFLLHIKSVTLNYIQRMDDEMLKTESWENLKEIISLINLMFHRHQLEKSAEVTELLQLELLFRLLTSNIIDKRLFALNELKTFIKEVYEDDSNNKKMNGIQQRFLPLGSSAGSPSSPTGMTNPFLDHVYKYHTPKALAKWIEEKNLLDELFHNNPHSELIRQSKVILLFLADSIGLKQKEVEIIWTSTIGRHEAIQRTIYELIIAIVPSLNALTTNLFFEQIENINLATLNEHTIEFIEKFIIEAFSKLKKTKDKRVLKWNGLKIFWDLITNEEVDNRLSQRAFESLKSLIVREEFEGYRKSIIKACLLNLKDHKCVPYTLLLIEAIVRTYPIEKKKKASMWGMIEYMNEKAKLFDILFNDLHFASSKFEKFSEQNANTVSNGSASQNSLQRHITKHLEEMGVRLGFLSFILKNSSFTLSFSQCSILWNNLHTKYIYRDLFCSWFETLINLTSDVNKSYSVFAEGTVEKIFYELIKKKVIVKEMSPCEFSLFHAYFLVINVKNNLIQVNYDEELIDQPINSSKEVPIASDEQKLSEEPKEKISLRTSILRSKSLNYVAQTAGKYMKQQIQRAHSDRHINFIGKHKVIDKANNIKGYLVLSAELIGIEYLWDIVLNNTDNEVVQLAIQYLNNYRYNFSESMKKKKSEVIEMHISRCMKEITELLNNYGDNESIRKIHRCLDLLIDYLYLFAEKIGLQGHGISTTGVPLRIQILSTEGQEFVSLFQSTDTASDLYRRISYELNYPSYLMQLFSCNLEIMNDNKPLEKIGIKETEPIIAKKINIKDVGFSLVKFQLKALGLDALVDVLTKQSIEKLQNNIKNQLHSNGVEQLNTGNNDIIEQEVCSI
jgi:hypothetical protein